MPDKRRKLSEQDKAEMRRRYTLPIDERPTLQELADEWRVSKTAVWNAIRKGAGR